MSLVSDSRKRNRSPAPAVATPTKDAIGFLLCIGRALHQYGTPAHRLEAILDELARSVGLTGQFFATPTSMFIALGEEEDQRTFLLRVEPGELNLGKLIALDRITESVVDGSISLRKAEARVYSIVSSPLSYGVVVRTLAHGVCCASAAVFFGGQWRESVLAGLIGLIIGLMWIVLDRHRRAKRLSETLAGALAAAIAVLGAWYWSGQVTVSIVTLAGLIVLLPGLTLTVAINELATRNLASGTARLMGGLTILVALGFGAALGLRVQSVLPIVEATPEPLTSLAIELPLLVSIALAFTILFQARARDYVWILLTAGLALYGGRYASATVGAELGPCIGAFAVGLVSNLIANLRNLPAVVTGMPGIILLVPGSIGFRSFRALMDHEVIHGVDGAFTMFLVGISIVFGLFLASVALPTDKEF